MLICFHVMFQISFQNSKGQKSYRQVLGVRSELLLSIFPFYKMKTNSIIDRKEKEKQFIKKFTQELNSW